jgi:hypothetical protein
MSPKESDHTIWLWKVVCYTFQNTAMETILLAKWKIQDSVPVGMPAFLVVTMRSCAGQPAGDQRSVDFQDDRVADHAWYGY